jgi:hypothetical protein
MHHQKILDTKFKHVINQEALQKNFVFKQIKKITF